MVVNLFETLRCNFYFPRCHSFSHELFQCHVLSGRNASKFCFLIFEFYIYSDKPLSFYLRLYHPTTTAVRRDVVHIILVDLNNKALTLQFLDDSGAGFLDVLSGELARDGQEDSALVDDLLDVEPMPLCYLEVDCAVRGRYRHRAGAHLHIGSFVFYHGRRDGTVYPFELYVLPVLEVYVPPVVGVHDDILIAEFRLGAHGADNEWTVLEMIEGVLLLDVLDLIVRDGRLQFRVPIHDAVAAVYQSRFVHADEGLHHRLVSRLVHRICVTAPIER